MFGSSRERDDTGVQASAETWRATRRGLADLRIPGPVDALSLPGHARRWRIMLSKRGDDMGLAGQIKRVAVDRVHALMQLPPLEATLVQLTQGRAITHPVARLAPVNADYARPSYRTVSRNGINYRLDISDYQDWIVYWGLCTDRPEDLYPLIGKDNVVFDVGSNLGDVCLTAATLVGPGGKVYAFEPDPVSYAKLTENLARNSFQNIVASQLGLGEVPGTLTMKVNSPGNRGGNRVATESGPAGADSFPVNIETIDRFVTQQQVSRVDVIKVDVEGFEMQVLRGARETLLRWRPALFVEVVNRNLCDQGTSSEALIGYLRDLGYRIWQARTGQELASGQPLPPVFDAICKPKG
jgi:FkbM family methyltransferase